MTISYPRPNPQPSRRRAVALIKSGRLLKDPVGTVRRRLGLTTIPRLSKDLLDFPATRELSQLLPDGFVSSWSLAPGSIQWLVDFVESNGIQRVAEFGSGVSTVALGILFKSRGSGNLLSFEHDRTWYEQGKAIIRRLCLEKHVILRHSPLTESNYGVTYSERETRGSELIVVDGPPTPPGREPLFLALRSEAAAKSIVLVDDMLREKDVSALARAGVEETRIRFVPVGNCLALWNVDQTPERQY